MKKIPRRRFLGLTLIVLILFALVSLPSWLGQALDREHAAWLEGRTAASRAALQATGLPTHAASDALTMDTHGGFHGDGDTTTLFLVPAEEQAALLQSMQTAAGWHTEAVSMNDFRTIAEQWFWEGVIAWPAPDTVFDAWFYCNDQGNPAHSAYEEGVKQYADTLAEVTLPNSTFSVNRRIAFFDEETGLFYFYEQDS